MKRQYLFATVIIALLVFAVSPVIAVKPTDNLAGAQEVLWNLSADVMPVPPYGAMDIPGSDAACKLIMNQPNGAVEVSLTGVMNGLNPNTQYTVYLSREYTAYEYTGWSISGDWIMRAVLGGNYDHDYTITQASDGTFTATGGYPASGPPYSITETVTGTIDVMTGEITFNSVYNNGYWYVAEGQIQADGSIIGTWGNDGQGYEHPWYSISGTAIKTHTGNTGWPGLFTSTIQPFTFMTDEYGTASWHLNLKDANFPGAGTYYMSVWINEAGRTMLISNVFSVEVD